MNRDVRFFRWFRVLPLAVMGISLIMCLLLYETETTFSKSIFFPVHYGELIEESAERHGVDPTLVCAIIKCESDWDEWAESAVGAKGLMQVMPATAETMANWGRVDTTAYPPSALEVPAVNIEYGCAILAYLQGELNSVPEVIAAYNAGLGSVQEWLKDGGDITNAIEFPETAAYLAKVTVALEGYRAAYPVGIVDRTSSDLSER